MKDEALKSEIKVAIDFYRGIILDAVEQEFSETPQWPFLRRRLLKALGDRGLSGKIEEIFAKD